jgi:hypothetical protein
VVAVDLAQDRARDVSEEIARRGSSARRCRRPKPAAWYPRLRPAQHVSGLMSGAKGDEGGCPNGDIRELKDGESNEGPGEAARAPGGLKTQALPAKPPADPEAAYPVSATHVDSSRPPCEARVKPSLPSLERTRIRTMTGRRGIDRSNVTIQPHDHVQDSGPAY